MSYRKIEVNGKKYEYVVGKTNIKIKEVGVFPIAGNSDFYAHVCECCGATNMELYGEPDTGSLGVTPKHIRSLILKNVKA